MDKKELRRTIRERKRAMTEEEIVSHSEKLGKLVAVQILVTKEIEDEHFGGASLEIVLTLAHVDHSFFLKFL